MDNNETKPDVATFSIDTKQKIQKSLKTTNNVHLNFVTLKQENSKTFIKYNLNAIINQDEICPVISRAKFNTSNAITCSINFSTYNLSGKSDTTNDNMYKRRPYFFHCLKTTGFLKPTLPGTHMEENGPYGLSATIPQITQTCAGYIKHAKEMSKFKEIDFTDYKEKKLWNGKVASINCKYYIEKNENKKIIQDCTMEPPASNIALLYINVKLNSKKYLILTLKNLTTKATIQNGTLFSILKKMVNIFLPKKQKLQLHRITHLRKVLLKPHWVKLHQT